MIKKGCLLWIVMVLVSGCESEKAKMTPEQMAEIPYVNTDNLPAPSGGFVLSIGDDTLTSEDIINHRIKRGDLYIPLVEYFRAVAKTNPYDRFYQRARPELESIVLEKISDILIYNEAKKQAGEGIEDALDKAVDAEVQRFIIRYGGDYARAEEALRQMELDWESYRDVQKRIMMSQSYLSQQLTEMQPVTYSELVKIYEEMKDEFFTAEAMIKFSLIDIQISKVKQTESQTDRNQAAKQLAYELVARLHSGENFAELAKQYSHGHRAVYGGSWKELKPDSLARPYHVIAEQTEKMRNGDIAGPIKADDHYFIIKLEEKTEHRVLPFEEVQEIVESKIKLDRNRQQVVELKTKLMNEAAIANKEEFIDFCLAEIYKINNL